MNDNYSNVPQGYKHAGQSPLDAKVLVENLSEVDYTVEPALPYSFYDGMIIYVFSKKKFFVWTDQINDVPSENHLFPETFTYASGSQYSEIDYSGKIYSFVVVSIVIGKDNQSDTLLIGNIDGHIDLAASIAPDNKDDLITLRDYLTYLYKRNNLNQFNDNLFAFTNSESIRQDLDDLYLSNSMYYTFGNTAAFDDYSNPQYLTIQAIRRPETLSNEEELPCNGFIHALANQIYENRTTNHRTIIRLQSHDGHFVEFYNQKEHDFKVFESLSNLLLSFNNYKLASKIVIGGLFRAKFGTIENKAVKIFIYNVYLAPRGEVNGRLRQVKESIVSFTRKQVNDNLGVLQHNLNVLKYLSEHFAYSTESGSNNYLQPTTLTPSELVSSRTISQYGPNDSNTIYLKDLSQYNSEDENNEIYYVVKYIENGALDLLIPDGNAYAINQNNDPDDPIKTVEIDPIVFLQGLYDPNDHEGQNSDHEIHILSITNALPQDSLQYDSVLVDDTTIIDFGDLKTLLLSFSASGTNRNIITLTYKVICGSLESNIGEFKFNKISNPSRRLTPPSIYPTYLLNGQGDIVTQWGVNYRLMTLVDYRLQAIVNSVNQSTGLEVSFEVYDETESRVIFSTTLTNIDSGDFVHVNFDFDYSTMNVGLRSVIFKFTVTENDGLETTVSKKLYIIY